MPIQGFRNTGNFAVDERPKSWRESVLLRYPNGNAPLFALTNMMKSEKVDDPEFNWWEKPLQDRRLQVGVAFNDTVTTITIAASTNALLFKPGDVLFAPQTSERFLITAVPSATSITVVRGFAGSTPTAFALTAGLHPFLIGIGSVFPENSLPPNPIGNEPVKNYNYTQIFRDSFAATRTAMRTKLRTGDQVKEARRECLELHALGIERALFHGLRWEGTVPGSSQPARMTQGVLGFIPPENVQTAGATTDMQTLETWFERAFRFGSSEKLGFAGSTALLVLQQIIRKNTNYQIFAREKEYGMAVMRLVSPFGELVLKNHPMFNLDRQAATTYGNSMAASVVILDGANLRYRYVDDTKFEPKHEANGQDGMQSGFLTECGLEVHHGITHSHWRNLTAAALDS